MGARHKLNATAIYGILIVAGLVALMAGSWTLFWLLAAVMLAASLHDGSIRISPDSGGDRVPRRRGGSQRR